MGPRANRPDDVYATLLALRESQGRLRRLAVAAPGAVDFSSNDYLSLAADPGVTRAYLARLQAQAAGGGLALGAGSSRLLDGNSAAAEALEDVVAGFHGAAAGLLFGSGFEANAGLFGCAPRPGDVVVYDELVHASVHDGMRLGRARAVPFAHNRVDVDDAADDSCDNGPRHRSSHDSLDAVLAALTRGPGAEARSLRAGRASVFVAVESVYSMDGDVAPLAAIVACAERRLPRANACVVVDEAHATGWLGPAGRGLVCHLGLQDRVWARVHTFGKAVGCAGAIVLCSPTTRAYLINYARSVIYTTAMPPPTLLAVKTAYDHLERGLADPSRLHLLALMRLTHRLLAALCSRRRPPSATLRLAAGPPASPIIPLFTRRARSLAQYCQRRGFTVRPIVAPTVPAGTDRVRLCLHAGNTPQQVQGLCAAIEEWVCQRLAEEDTGLGHDTPTEADAGQGGQRHPHESTSKL